MKAKVSPLWHLTVCGRSSKKNKMKKKIDEEAWKTDCGHLAIQMGKIASVGDKLCQTAAFKVWFVDFHRHRHHNPWHAALCSIDKDSTNPMITPRIKEDFLFMRPFSNLRVNEGELFWQDCSPPLQPPATSPPPRLLHSLDVRRQDQSETSPPLKAPPSPFSSN